MRNIVLTALAIGIALPALAIGHKSVKLDLKLEVNNHVVTQPKIIVPFDKKSITQVVTTHDTYVIEVTPKQDIDNQIYLSFTLRKIIDGKSFVISHPRMITLNNQEVVIEEGDSATSDAKNVILSVTPHL